MVGSPRYHAADPIRLPFGNPTRSHEKFLVVRISRLITYWNGSFAVEAGTVDVNHTILSKRG